MWPHEGHLVNILKRPAASQQGSGGTAEEEQGALGHLSVFEGGDGVGHPGPCRDGGDTGDTAQAGRGIGPEDGGCFIPDIYDAYALFFGFYIDRGNMPSAEGKQVRNPGLSKYAGDDLTSVHVRWII
jgi:hypothetical protein